MQITGTVVDWGVIWAWWGGTAVLCVTGGLTWWAVRSALKLSRRKDV